MKSMYMVFMVQKFFLITLLGVGLFLEAQCTNADPGMSYGDTGCVSFTYQGQAVNYATVRANDGKIWLQQNLGSSQVATSVTDADSYGDLFQWGRWDDGHQLRNSPNGSIPSPNNPAGITPVLNHYYIRTGQTGWWNLSSGDADEWGAPDLASVSKENGMDPCKSIGSGWRLPTEAEFVSLQSAEGITSYGTGYASILKLPASGERNATNGSLQHVGVRSSYWTSDVSVGNGKYFRLVTSAQAISVTSKGTGIAVRCVKSPNVLAVQNLKTESLGVFPNPTSGIIKVKTESSVRSAFVYNSEGRKLDVEIENNELNLMALPAGIYFVNIILENGKKISNKIIKK